MPDQYGATERDCPLCHDMDDKENAIPPHIRNRCPVAERIRTEELGLPPEGFDAGPLNANEESGFHEAVGRDPETGHFVSRGETA